VSIGSSAPARTLVAVLRWFGEAFVIYGRTVAPMPLWAYQVHPRVNGHHPNGATAEPPRFPAEPRRSGGEPPR